MKESVQGSTSIIEELQLKIRTLESQNRLLKERLNEAGISYMDITSQINTDSAEFYDPNQEGE